MIQVEKIEAVIDTDATGTGYLLDSRGKMCVMGGLLAAAGVDPEDFRGRASLSGENVSTIKLEYGLTDHQIVVLIQENDLWLTTRARRRHLKLWLRAMVAL